MECGTNPRATDRGISAVTVSSQGAKNVLVGVTGSVASIRLPKLVNELHLLDPKPNVRVVATENALHFFEQDEIPVQLYREKDEWEAWKTIQDPVLHIELRRWADVMVIAPLDANTMGKIANGLCDNLLTCVVRAWDTKKPLVFCPAMNTFMWEHPITSQQVTKLTEMGYKCVQPIKKLLACGDLGTGGMAEVSTIVTFVKDQLKQSSP